MARALSAALALAIVCAGSPAHAESEARGIVRAAREAVLAAPIGARIRELPFREGDRVGAGDLLVAFACEAPEAETRAAEAEARAGDLTLRSSQTLHARGAIGVYDLELARMRLDKAVAARDGLAARQRECRLYAPFPGRVADLRARLHETPAAGAPLLRLLDDKALEIDLIVASAMLPRLAPGMTFTVRVDDTGETIDAVLRVLPAMVDPVSQTARITATLVSPRAHVLPGMAVTADLLAAGG